MRSLSSLGSKNLGHRRGRTILTGLGVALGVALLFGVLVANTSVNRSFERATYRSVPQVNESVSRTDNAPLTEEAVMRLFALPNVRNGSVWPDRRSATINVQGIDPKKWEDTIARPALGSDYQFGRAFSVIVGTNTNDDNGFAEFRSAIEGSLAAFSAVALFVGGFLIYLTFSTAVLERTALYGLLRALGAHPSQVRRAVLAESLVLGGVSSLVGLVLGFGVASVTTRLLAEAIGIQTPPTEVHLLQVVIAVTMGVVTAVVSALIPARRAAAVDPVAAMRSDHRPAGRLSKWWLAGAVAVPAGIALSLRYPSLDVAPVSATLIVVGSVLLVPPLLKPLARALGILTTRISRGGRIPVMHLVKERSRSAYTLALIMVVLAMAYSLVAASTSMHEALDEVFDKQYRTDLVATGLGPGFRSDELETISHLPGVRSITALGFGRTSIAGRGANVVVIDPSTYFSMLSFTWRDGDDVSAAAALTRGGAVLVPADLAERAHLHRGDRVTLPTPTGPHDFTVAGTFARFGFLEDMGVIAGTADGPTFLVDAPVALRVNVSAGTPVSVVQEELRALPRDFPTRVQTVAALRSVVLRDVDRYFRLFFAVVLVALIVGLLGLANTLGMSIFERTREVGVLRATGMQRAQIGSMVVVESVTLALAAFVLAIPLGMIQAHLLTNGTREEMGFGGGGSQPIAWLVPVGLLATAVAALAALLPARRAARVEIVEALRFE